MECGACGYICNWDSKDWMDRFIKLDLTCTIQQENNEGFNVDVKAHIYACPECKTLILND